MQQHPSRGNHIAVQVGRWVWHHIVEALPSALLIAAAVTLLHENTTLLNAIDSYAFIQVGHIVALADDPAATGDPSQDLPPRKTATVLLIDPDLYASAYAELAPLNRCRLLGDVRRLYAARPKLLAIDFDLSPAIWLKQASSLPKNLSWGPCESASSDRQIAPACQRECEEHLYSEIENSGIPTVLMLPGSGTDDDAAALTPTTLEWIERLKRHGVRFGHSRLLDSYGIVLDAETGNDSIAEQACIALLPTGSKAACFPENDEKTRRINPRVFMNGVISRPLSAFVQQDGQSFSDKFVTNRVVFLGSAWDRSDVSLTLVGQLFGAEIHAASFLSIRDHSHHKAWLAFLVDIAIALAFGFMIEFCWKRYFRCRFSIDARERQHAPVYVIGLGAGFLFILLPLALVVSHYLLSRWSIWASPIPLAAGMLVESFASGSVSQAIRAAFDLTHRTAPGGQGLRHMLKSAVADVVNLWRKVDNPALEQAHLRQQIFEIEKEIHALEKQAAPAHRRRYHLAAVWLALRRLAWAAIVFGCLGTILFKS